jgi:hypothetical protein
MYDKVTGITAVQACCIAAIAIPGYLMYTECKAQKVNSSGSWSTKITDTFKTEGGKKKSAKGHEEDILEAKIRSENLRPGPAFLDAHLYHNRRTERVKTAYTSSWSLVNQNLESGNRHFRVAISENDLHILNVVVRLLVEELGQDGYTAEVSIHPLKENKNIEEEFYLDIDIQ